MSIESDEPQFELVVGDTTQPLSSDDTEDDTDQREEPK